MGKSAGARAFLAVLSVFAVLSLSIVFPVTAGASLHTTGQLGAPLEEVGDLVTVDDDDSGTVQVVLSLVAVDELLEIQEFRPIVKDVDEISGGLANVLISTKAKHWEDLAEALELQMPLPADLIAALAELEEALLNPTPATTTTTAPVPTTTSVPVPTTTAAPMPTTTAAPIPTTTAAPVPATTAAPPPATTAGPTTIPVPATTVPTAIPEAQVTASESGGTLANPPVTMSPPSAADSAIFSDLAPTEGVERPTLAPYDPHDGGITAVAGESAEATKGSILNIIANSAVLPWAAGTVLILAAGLVGLAMQRSLSR